jgi:hypothetical protein
MARRDHDGVAAELPRCAICRVTVKPGENVIFRGDGRVHHAVCPEVVCPVCTRAIKPNDPIRRDGDLLVHGNCWLRRMRSMPREHGSDAGRRAASA